METKPQISVIVPVYKVEPYLQKCIDSILAQTFRDIEVILVDDGSPDNCPAICDAAAEKDERVRVIHQKNGGLSAARNAGLDIARGEWIGFVDSDDYIAPEMYQTLYNTAIKNDAQLALCSYAYVDIQGGYCATGGRPSKKKRFWTGCRQWTAWAVTEDGITSRRGIGCTGENCLRISAFRMESATRMSILHIIFSGPVSALLLCRSNSTFMCNVTMVLCIM